MEMELALYLHTNDETPNEKNLIAPNFAMPCMGLWGTTPGASEFEAETWY